MGGRAASGGRTRCISITVGPQMGKIQDACWYITARSRVNKISGSCIVVCAFESIREMTKSTPRRSREQLRSRPLARLRFAREVSSLLTEWALRRCVQILESTQKALQLGHFGICRRHVQNDNAIAMATTLLTKEMFQNTLEVKHHKRHGALRRAQQLAHASW